MTDSLRKLAEQARAFITAKGFSIDDEWNADFWLEQMADFASHLQPQAPIFPFCKKCGDAPESTIHSDWKWKDFHKFEPLQSFEHVPLANSVCSCGGETDPKGKCNVCGSTNQVVKLVETAKAEPQAPSEREYRDALQALVDCGPTVDIPTDQDLKHRVHLKPFPALATRSPMCLFGGIRTYPTGMVCCCANCEKWREELKISSPEAQGFKLPTVHHWVDSWEFYDVLRDFADATSDEDITNAHAALKKYILEKTESAPKPEGEK